MNNKFNYWFILLISIFLGYFGIDRFIIGDKKIGLIKLFTCSGCGILWLIDIILFATKSNNNIEYTTSKNSKIIGISILVVLCFNGLIFNISKNYVKNNKKLASDTSTPIKSTPTKTLTLTPNITIKPTPTKPLSPEEIKKQKEAEEKLDKYIKESEGKREKDVLLNTPKEEVKPSEENISIEHKNALKKAETYSNTMHMSKKGIYEQLTSEYGEQFPAKAAQYAIDNIQADWNGNALKKAKTYQSTMNMSKKAIYNQLISEYGEKFTPQEAQYAIDHLN
jgi:hypothetical protein